MNMRNKFSHHLFQIEIKYKSNIDNKRIKLREGQTFFKQK